MKLYNFVKRDQLAESEICMPIIARYGTGGGNTPLVLMEKEVVCKKCMIQAADITTNASEMFAARS